MADDVQRGHDKERVIEDAGGTLLDSAVLKALAKTDRGDQEQPCRKQVPRTGQPVRGMGDRRGGGGKKSRARHLGRQRRAPSARRGFLTRSALRAPSDVVRARVL